MNSIVHDTTLGCTLIDCNLSINLQAAMDSIHNWFMQWHLPLCPEKSPVLAIVNDTSDAVYYASGDRLRKVVEERDLRYLLSEKLDFTSHYRMLVNKANRRMHNLFKFLRNKNVKVLLKAYKTYVRPTTYASRMILIFLKVYKTISSRKVVMRCLLSHSKRH